MTPYDPGLGPIIIEHQIAKEMNRRIEVNKKQERLETAGAFLYAIAKTMTNARIVNGEVLVHTADGHAFYICGFNNVSDFKEHMPKTAERLYVEGDEKDGDTEVQDSDREPLEAGEWDDLGTGAESGSDSSDGDSELERV